MRRYHSQYSKLQIFDKGENRYVLFFKLWANHRFCSQNAVVRPQGAFAGRANQTLDNN